MRILHISADFPDPLVREKTRAILRLVEGAGGPEHRVWSLNRIGGNRRIDALDFGPGHRAVAYGAPPKGFLLRTRLEAVADFILADAARAGVVPDIVHAHKLSVEGIVGARVAEALGVPLAISSQGDSDLRILSARPDLTPLWRRIWHRAAVVFPFAPWTAARLSRRLGERNGPVVVLPCPLGSDTMMAPRLRSDDAAPRIVSVFHLAVQRRKNAARLVAAAAEAARDVPGLTLEIAGGGDPVGYSAVSAHIVRSRADCARLAGPKAADEIPAFLNGATAMALPSRRESFGMVFVEALFAGCPIVWPRDWGIDGYVEDGSVGRAVDPSDTASIAEALRHVARDEATLKAQIAEMQANGALERFTGTAITQTYLDAMTAAVSLA